MGQFRPSYHDQKEAYQSARDAQDIERTMQQILMPVTIARQQLGLTQAQQQIEGAKQDLDLQKQQIEEKRIADGAYADQLSRAQNGDTSPPKAATGAEAKARMQAIFNHKQAMADDQRWITDSKLRTERAEEDAAAQSLAGMTNEEWDADPAAQKDARLQHQFSTLRGRGLTEDQLVGMKLGDRPVGDILADGANYTPRGKLKDGVFKDLETLVKQAADTRAVKLEGEKAAAREGTPADIQKREDAAKARAARLSMDATAAARMEANARPELRGPERDAFIDRKTQELLEGAGGPGSAAPKAGFDSLFTTPKPAAGGEPATRGTPAKFIFKGKAIEPK